MINKKTKPIDSAKSVADLSTTKPKLLPKIGSFPDIFFLSKIKLIISEKVMLIIIKYETGLVSLFIVLLKLNKRTAINIDEIIGIPGINQVKFNNIILTQD
tara:strand:+ start:338 stop:640 length:303 start_codon:yes stop_codon:yes gene_type:complete